MDINKFFQSKGFKWTLLGLIIFVLLLGSFATGVSIGYHKARFSYAWGDNYDRNFGGPRRGLFGFDPGLAFTNSHGVVGSIINISTSSLSVSGRDGIEKTVLFSSSTIVRENREEVNATDLEKGEAIMVLGAPNSQGQIQAELIRVLPPMQPVSPTMYH